MADNTATRQTRGHGLLEPMLARLRANMANHLIPDHLRTGKILDIGCGSYPYFLSRTHFEEKYAIDQLDVTSETLGIKGQSLDLNKTPQLPYEDNYFQIVTMLAVVEHLDPTSMELLFKDIHRVLAPGGMVIMTTPSGWTDPLLKTMARLNLVSAEEIDEHAYAYTLPLLGWYLGRGGFDMTKVNFGYFEMRMNMWATASK